MRTDSQLLDDYARRGDEGAFREFVERLGGLVHAAALRQTRDRALAEEAVQNVFRAAAAKAAPLSRHVAPMAWLHRAARLECLHLLRAERRRRARETAGFYLTDSSIRAELDPGPAWDAVRPLLDRGLNSLGATDRQALLLRFFRDLSFREVAADLGVREDAAKMRVGRALEKLRRFLHRHGVQSTASALAMLLTREAPAVPLPSALTTQWSAAVLSAVPPAAMGTGLLTATLTFMSPIKLTAALALLAFLLPPALKWSGLSQTSGTIPGQSFTAPHLERASPSLRRARSEKSGNRLTPQPRDPLLAELERGVNYPEDPYHDYSRLLDLTQLVFGLEPARFRGALDILKSARSPAHGGKLMTALLSRWAETDAGEAFHVAGELAGPMKTAAMEGVLSVWMRQAPDAALARLGEIPDVRERREFLEAAYRHLSHGNPKDTLTRAGSIADAGTAAAVKESALQIWASLDPEEALKWVRMEEPETSRDTAERQVIRTLAMLRPDKALELAQTMANPQARNHSVEEALRGWAVQDTAAARDAMLALPPEILKTAYLTNATLQMAWLDPAGTAAVVDKLAMEAGRSDLANAVAHSWLRADRDSALAWIQSTRALSEEARENLLNTKTP
jgi:RNA polymerase sigma factor (sigma-70 family)